MKLLQSFRTLVSEIPAAGWLLGIYAMVILECTAGSYIAWNLGLPKIPAIFGFLIFLKKAWLIPNTFAYIFLVYALPILGLGIATRKFTNNIAAILHNKFPLYVSVILYLIAFYLALHLWAGVNGYRELIVKASMIAIIITLSLNVINGYMGEFSCSHPGFMAVGAYISSLVTFFSVTNNDMVFHNTLLPEMLGHLIFPFALIIGGAAAALSSLVVAIPSFRTRGDYLAIISLAYMFIVISIINNSEFVGGSRGMMGHLPLSTLPVVFTWTVLCVWIINNFVRSILGKALNAVRDSEPAANAMTVNTRKTKITAFMFSAFWAGVAGGLLAHFVSYLNPGQFDLKKLAEVFAMVYLGGLNSIVGSIVGAVGVNLLSEALRPLEVFKWIVIPVLLISVMIFRPTGLIAFREFDVKKILKPKPDTSKE